MADSELSGKSLLRRERRVVSKQCSENELRGLYIGDLRAILRAQQSYGPSAPAKCSLCATTVGAIGVCPGCENPICFYCLRVSYRACLRGRLYSCEQILLHGMNQCWTCQEHLMEDAYDDADDLDSLLTNEEWCASRCDHCSGLMVVVCDKCYWPYCTQCIRCGPEHDCGATPAGTGEAPVLSV